MKACIRKAIEAKLQKQYASQLHLRLKARLTERSAFLEGARQMKRKVIITGLCLMLVFSITACGTKGDTAKTASAEKSSSQTESTAKKNDNSTEASTEETTVIEVSEEASATKEEDGSITVKTESGEEIKVKPTDKQEKNADGSVTYTTEDGQKVTINESTGSTTVTSEVKVPTSSETAPSSETPSGNSGSTEASTEHRHSYTATVTKQPTCTGAGEKTYTCSCGHQYKDVISKTGHTAGGWEVKENATCKKEGTEVKKCTSCGKEMETRAIAKTGHTSSDWVVTKEATETVEGTKVKTCTTCGTTLETASIAKVAHTCNYQWETNGNTRTLKCSCGATGITEECVAGVWGYFDYGAAQELFNWVNNTRAEATYEVQDDDGHTIDIATVPALTNFDGLYATAKQRAAEIATNYGHAGMKTDNENLGGGAANAQECYEAWCYSKSHARTMINQIYTQGSCAVFWHDVDGTGENLYPYYVLVVNK